MTTSAARWRHHDALFRDSRQIAAQWEEAAKVDPVSLRHRVKGKFWEAVRRAGVTLLVSREYEHLVMGLSVRRGRPSISYLRLPHPSGIAVDRRTGAVSIASTRNPNQVFEFRPATGALPRLDSRPHAVAGTPLVPVASRFYAGSFYMHDLAFIGGALFANTVGRNAVTRLGPGSAAPAVWWPKCVERNGRPVLGQNHIQLNSIAAGPSLRGSFFSASAAVMTATRPGHPDFPVDGRGVIFSGATREPVVRGLTRPHSARLHAGRLWVDNSGYGELCVVQGERARVVTRLPGWTRGLCFAGGVAFVGTSRVIPRFRAYAPGLRVATSVCGVHAVDARTGRVLGSLVWPGGNQIFAVEWVDHRRTAGFPWPAGGAPDREELRRLFYTFDTKERA